MTQAHIFISGFVQGVGYRQFVRSHARKLGLTGWVRNLSDGRVEALLQGAKEDIEKIISYCKKGPLLSEVQEVVVDWTENEEQLPSFEILPQE